MKKADDSVFQETPRKMLTRSAAKTDNSGGDIVGQSDAEKERVTRNLFQEVEDDPAPLETPGKMLTRSAAKIAENECGDAVDQSEAEKEKVARSLFYDEHTSPSRTTSQSIASTLYNVIPEDDTSGDFELPLSLNSSVNVQSVVVIPSGDETQQYEIVSNLLIAADLQKYLSKFISKFSIRLMNMVM